MQKKYNTEQAASRFLLDGWLAHFCCTNSPAQEPTKACSYAFHSMIVVVIRIQMERRINSFIPIERLKLFRILPDTPQNRVSGFALLIPQRRVHTIRPTLWLTGEDVLLHAGKPEEAGHAAYAGK